MKSRVTIILMAIMLIFMLPLCSSAEDMALQHPYV